MNLGFVIGCSKYDDPDINSLKYPSFDAADIAEVLRTRCGLMREEVTVLTSDSPSTFKATRANIIRELAKAKNRIRNRKTGLDNLFLFFRGHGFHSALNSKVYALL